MNLTNKAALVNGGARRVGRAIALELARAGCDVAVHFNGSKTEAVALVEQLRAEGRHAAAIDGDLSDLAAWSVLIERAVEALGRLDILVNNAALFLTDTPDDLDGFDVGAWERMLRVNLIAPVGLCHHASAHLSAHGDGCIVNLCDISIERPWPEHLSYAASKAGLVAMTKALARALAPTVRVNGVAPGIAIFPESYSQALREKLIDRVPLKRKGTPEDVARAVRYLCETGTYLTGQIINVDGGRSII
jgi:pteridine reductase